MKAQLAKLSKVENLQEVWPNEAQDLTPWLADNLELLGETIGMDLDLVGTEYLLVDSNKKVDILAKRIQYEEEQEEHKVVIENQLDKTDYKHLGQLLTYASGLTAKTVVWVAKKITDEHKKALDWLNENSSEDVDFFGLELELWKIDNSLPAPKFNIVSKPNHWFKNIQSQVNKILLTPIQKQQYEFWTEFKEYLEKEGTNLPKPLPNIIPKNPSFLRFSMGRTHFGLLLNVNSQKKEVGCKLRIPETNKWFYKLEKEKDIINKELSIDQDCWKEKPNKKGSVIAQYKTGNFENEDEREQLFAWLKERAEAFYKTFYDRIQNLDFENLEDKEVA